MNPKIANDYQKYLVKLHSKIIIPKELIIDTVKEFLDKDVNAITLIISGEVNKVFELVFSDKTRAILRVSTNNLSAFQTEILATEKCKTLNIPVPEILFIKKLIINDETYSFCLMVKMDGQILQRGKINFDKLSNNSRKRYIQQAGEILSKIHSIPTKGFAKLTENDKGEFKDANEQFNYLEKHIDTYSRLMIKTGLKRNIYKDVARLISSFRNRYKHISPRLNHGDFFCKHFMVKDGRIIGIIDWGEVRSDNPVYDFANWSFWSSDTESLKWLKAGYLNSNLFDSEFEDFLHFNRILIGLNVLDWYHKENYEPFVKKAKSKLIEDILYFQ